MEMLKTIGIFFAIGAVFFLIGGKRGKLLGGFIMLVGIPMQLIDAIFPDISLLLNFVITVTFAVLVLAAFAFTSSEE